jgi:CubicO group peptidase (beta-lactamase class C family)
VSWGAACAAYYRGALVVDLWGGYRDVARRVSWERDTLVLVYSTCKGLAAMTVALAHSRGWTEFDAPVASYWPQFAQNGKERVTVRQLLAHQAGLCAIDEPLTAASRRFVMLLGHELSEVDVVVERRPGYSVVEKHGRAGSIAESEDPRA